MELPVPHAELPTELLVNIFEFCDGALVLTRFALVCKTWRAVSLETELWRRLIARRWAALHSHDAVDVDGLLGPATACYTMQDVYMRLVATPSHLVCTSAKLALSAPPGGDANAPTVATFTGNVLGGNQTARADAPWSCSVGGGMHAGSGFHSPPVGTLRACSEREQLPPGARALQSRAGARASVQLCAELQLVHYFEATILPALEAPPGPNDRPLPFTHQRSCVAIGMCSQRFPLAGRMPGWDRHSFAYHGDDGCRFLNSSHGERYGPPFGEGDTIGCGVRLRPVVPDGTAGPPPGGDVFFTLNGTLLADPNLELGALGTRPLFACVGIDSSSPVRVNFGAEPFRFDVRAVHPLSEPSALGLPNPTERSDFARCIREHLRKSLRPPTPAPPATLPTADTLAGASAPAAEGAPAGAPMQVNAQQLIQAVMDGHWGENGHMFWALGQALPAGVLADMIAGAVGDSDDSDELVDDDESDGDGEDGFDEAWPDDESFPSDESGGEEAEEQDEPQDAQHNAAVNAAGAAEMHVDPASPPGPMP